MMAKNYLALNTTLARVSVLASAEHIVHFANHKFIVLIAKARGNSG